MAAESFDGSLDDEEEVVAAETFEQLCVYCEKGSSNLVSETMISNPRAESVWCNQRRTSDMATPVYIACLWGHSDTVITLLGNGANPLMRARHCKKDWCFRGFPCEPEKPCPGFVNPEHPDDPGCTALQCAKDRGHSHVIRAIKYHILNCVLHDECFKYRKVRALLCCACTLI